MIKYLLALLLCCSPAWAGFGVGVFPQPGPGTYSMEPILSVSDDFNRVNTNPAGGNWTVVNGISAIQVLNNAVKGTMSTGRSGAYWNAETFSDDQYAELKVITFDTGGANGGVAVRISPSAQTLYAALLSSTQVSLQKFVSGTKTELYTYNRSNSVGDIIRLEVNSTTLTVKINGYALAPSVDDSAISTGSPGVRFFDLTFVGDDFAAGNL